METRIENVEAADVHGVCRLVLVSVIKVVDRWSRLYPERRGSCYLFRGMLRGKSGLCRGVVLVRLIQTYNVGNFMQHRGEIQACSLS